MAITPPLDQLTKLPALGVDRVQQELNKLTDQTLDKTKTVIQESTKLPKGINCDDPRVQKIKNDLESVQEGIQKIQETIPRIQSIINSIDTLIKTALAVKTALSVAQLTNPITAPVFIANLATQLQNELIANAISAIKPLQDVPNQMISKLNTLVPPLTSAINKLNTACNENNSLKVPTVTTGDDDDGGVSEFGEDFDYNDLLPSEFYQLKNVSESDLDQRSDAIQQLVEQQQNLLTSLLEAPSKVYKQNGPPPADLGKPGDFYVDTQNNLPYGPKINDTEWGDPLN
jgi:archaellum component FlaC|tara:strand:- start:953 stop:1813 length:861 start_codon:yes stop_codon:yes gene_type:complete